MGDKDETEIALYSPKLICNNPYQSQCKEAYRCALNYVQTRPHTGGSISKSFTASAGHLVLTSGVLVLEAVRGRVLAGDALQVRLQG